MALVRWNPWRGLVSLEETNRLFDDFFSGRGDRLLFPERAEGVYWPAVDVSEADSEFVVRAELPGMKAEDVKISVDGHVLSIKGEKKLEKTEKERNFHRTERVFGSFERSFNLDSKVDSGKAKATFKDGVLEVRLAKVEESKLKEIPIQGK